MKTLFVSCPMRGKSVKEIFAVQEAAKKKAEAFLGEELLLIDQVTGNIQIGATPYECLIVSLAMMGDADYVYFVPDFRSERRCRVECDLAESYGMTFIREDYDGSLTLKRTSEPSAAAPVVPTLSSEDSENSFRNAD